MENLIRQRRLYFGVLGLFALLFLCLSAVFFKTERDLRQLRVDFAASQVARHFRQTVLDRVAMLDMLSVRLADNYPFDDAEYRDIVNDMGAREQGLQAINWVDANGEIAITEPVDGNEPAQGKNLLTHPLVANLLIASRQTGEPRISELVRLYQGVDGIAVYLPVYREGAGEGSDDEHIGWLNGVFAIRRYMDRFMVGRDLSQFYLRIGTAGSNRIYEYNEPDRPIFAAQSHVMIDLMKQQFEVRLHSQQRRVSGLNFASFVAILLMALASFGLLGYLTHRLLVTVKSLDDRRRNAEWLQTVLRAIFHDLANPLTVLRHWTSRYEQGAEVEAKRFWAPINRIVELQRTIRAVQPESLDLESIDVKDLLLTAVEDQELRMESKGLAVDLTLAEGAKVKGVSPILREGIVGNLLTSAIEAAPRGSTIQIQTTYEDGKAQIRIRDFGKGFDESRHGLRQASFFARAMGGDLVMEKAAGGGALATVTLSMA